MLCEVSLYRGREMNPGAWLRIAETGGLSCCHIAAEPDEVYDVVSSAVYIKD